MKIRIWGARGSVPSPGPTTTRYGGNTSCVQVTLADGTELVLDAGTGIRELGLLMPRRSPPLNILLTHLHLDHIQGLMFFTPLFRPEAEITIWGPASPEAPLRERIGRYISAPLAPVEVKELPCKLSFRDSPPSEWEIGCGRVRAASITHRGPTLGYRITEGDTTLCYIPDHEPGLGTDLASVEPEWISGYDLAEGASLLIHDCQYTDAEYDSHLGWGHSSLSHAVTFAGRAGVERLMLFHHDPLHSDDHLDAFFGDVVDAWLRVGGEPDTVELAVERRRLELPIGGRAAEVA